MASILATSAITLLVIGVPIAFVIGFSSLLAIFITGEAPLFLVTQRMFTGIDSFPLLAVPLFMIAGKLMEYGGISRRLIEFSRTLVGSVTGGMAMVSILSCMFFAAISGSSPATVAAIGSIMIPAMVKAGYDEGFSAAINSAAGTIGLIIPPSICFVTYGVTMGVSIGDLFTAGFIPGIMMGVGLMIYSYFLSKKRGYKGEEPASLRQVWEKFKDAIWALLMPLIILGGIYSGIFTPTEAAAVACVYSIVIGIFLYKELTPSFLITSITEAGVTSAMVMLIIGLATGMGWILTVEQIPTAISKAIYYITSTPFGFLLLVNIILLITGCIMEPNAAIIILGPMLLPIVQHFGINLVHFGVVMVMNLTIGCVTPPLGTNLFVAMGIVKNTTFNGLIRSIIMPIIVLITVLMIITYVPTISLLFL